MLFVEPVDPEALELARRAVDQSRGPGGFALHTLASVHAVRGEPAEAIQTIRQAVERGNPANQPESHDWLVVGLVAEAYGLPDDAAAAYRRVEPEPDDGLSSFTLAERRLKALGKPGRGAPPAAGPTVR